jgi:hypothetical protein
MHLTDINQKLEELHARCSAHEKLLKECGALDFTAELSEHVAAHHALKIRLESKLDQLKKSNQKLIRATDFKRECILLVNANDTVNLEGLVDIGEYFGIGPGPRGTDVVGGLDSVREWYRTYPSQRTSSNQTGLNKLCDLLHEPRLPIPKTNFDLFQNPRKKVQVIIKADAQTDLMMWLLHANQEDIDFALRLSASTDTSTECLHFLLLRAAPSAEYVKVNLLASGQPSGQIALHRAIQSQKITPLLILLDKESNPSEDILRQLLVCDSRNLRPIDLIDRINDANTRRIVINIVNDALKKYQSIPELQLSVEALHSVEETLNEIALKCRISNFSL